MVLTYAGWGGLIAVAVVALIFLVNPGAWRLVSWRIPGPVIRSLLGIIGFVFGWAAIRYLLLSRTTKPGLELGPAVGVARATAFFPRRLSDVAAVDINRSGWVIVTCNGKRLRVWVKASFLEGHSGTDGLGGLADTIANWAGLPSR